MSEPSKLRAGDTWTWRKDLPAYPADAWTLRYHLRNASQIISFSAVADGTTHVVNEAASTTTEHVPGRYSWIARVTDGTQVFTVGEGEFEVLPDLGLGGARDGRSVARVMLDNIEAYLIDPNNLAASSYSIGGRSLSRWSRSELLAERSRLQMEVRGEEAAARMDAGLGNPRRLYVRFDRG